MKDKKTLWIVIGVVGIFVLIGAIFGVKALLKDKNKDADNKTNTTIVEEKLIEAGRDFYEEYYYPLLEGNNQLDIIKGFAEGNGVNVELANLTVTTELSEETEAILKEHKCDYTQTIITIYPEDPFEIDDYKIKVTLSCEE